MAIRISRLGWAAVVAGVVCLGFVIMSDHPQQVKERPVESSFVGRWVLDPMSLPSVKKRIGEPPANSELVLGPDGRLTVTGMPYEEGGTRLPPFALVAGEGRWRIERQQDWAVTFALDGGRNVTLDIRTKDGVPAELAHSVGSADSNELWIWKKAP